MGEAAASGIRLDEPLAKVVGGRTATALRTGLGLETVGDLLRHYPRRYERLGELTPLADLPLGEEVTVLAEVVSAQHRQMTSRKGSLLNLVVTDGTDTLDLAFFHAQRLRGLLRPGRRALFSGTVTRYKGTRQLTHPRYRLVDGEDAERDALARVDHPIPVYPAARGVDSWAIEAAVAVVLSTLGEVPDPLPVPVRARTGLVSLTRALHAVHRPERDEDHREARRRLRFEEAFVLQAALARRRLEARSQPATPRVAREDGLLAAFDARLPFTLTAGQRLVGEQIAEELATTVPMHRLLQGEVGSGKTVVALRAMLSVVDAGGQAALLAPTEVLAAQHHRTMSAMLGDLARAGELGGDERGTRVALLTGSLPAAARRRTLLDVASGDAGIVVGTHALLAERVEFFDLGLVVVDEQHRFGVEQRDTLRGKARTSPHLLVMTATPIPRTVAMTVFGDLEVSTLRELPAGRAPIRTHVVPLAERPGWAERIWARVREEVEAGRQAYVVCPRIGGEEQAAEAPSASASGPGAGDQRPPRSVLEVLEELAGVPALRGLRVAGLHGRMGVEERDTTMRAFADGEVDVLVATTVIEVGVDVPRASAMVVLDADRFGVSQLHQLRGRVGRGREPGVCLLVTQAPADTPARTRLDAVAATVDGFELARVDLEQRREGDVLGAAQSGRASSLRLLRVVRDEQVIEAARHEATALVAQDPELTGHPALAAAIAELLDAERAAYLERG